MTRDEVKAAIHFGSPPRPPMAFCKWWGEGLWEQYGEQLFRFNGIREDADVSQFPVPSFEKREDGFCWNVPPMNISGKVGNDSRCWLPDWDDLPALLEKLPDTDAPGLFDGAAAAAENSRRENRYSLCMHWSLMYERIWSFRGMQNLLTDYYEYPEEVHKLHRAVLDTEKKLLIRCAEEVHPDGYMFSDDLGTQHSLMMSPAMFREFIKPYYKELFSLAHELGMDVWLHTCGCITEIIDDLIECGLDVLHPIQKHTMDWDYVADRWKGRICFWVGMDVQDTLINGTPDDVRKEVRLIRGTFDSPEGGLIYAAGNGIVRGTPIENIAAFLDECRNG